MKSMIGLPSSMRIIHRIFRNLPNLGTCTKLSKNANNLYCGSGYQMRCLSYYGNVHTKNLTQYNSNKHTTSAPSVPYIHNHHGSLAEATSILSWPTLVRTYAKGKGKDKGGKSQKKVKLTTEQLEGVIDMEKVTHDLDRVLEDLKDKFIHQVTVRTSQGVFNNLTVRTPDGNFPLIELGQVVQKSPQLVVINLAAAPQYIANVKEAFEKSGLNVNPQQDGTSLFVPLPKVTREHREGLAKNAKMLSEKSKKQLRDVYSKYSKKIKSSKEGHSADDLKAADDMVKDLMHDKVKHADEMTEHKRQELLGGK